MFGRVGAVGVIAAFGLLLALLPASAGSAMPTAGRATQPIGHYGFCQSNPHDCDVRSRRSAPLRLTSALWEKLVGVNNTVNLTVTPRTDMEMWGREEVWSYPTRVGDCEDYVLEKRLKLMQLGIPASALLITVVRQTNGAGHAVLTVRTDGGDFILDNLEERVLSWSDTPYTYLKRQSTRNSGEWVAIEDGRTVAVGSVR